MRTAIFSRRQRWMLETFVRLGDRKFMTIEEAQSFDQRPFRSMLIREYIAWRPSRGFHITEKGMDAWNEFNNSDITRKNPSLPLTAYFDPTQYGLRTTVHVIKKRGAA